MKSFKIHKDFIKIFHKKEQGTLYGKKLKNLIYLTIIITLTYISIGFANGSLAYLKKKMDDPFINWINVPIPLFTGSELNKVIPAIKENSIKFNIKSTSYFYQLTTQFRTNKSKKPTFVTGRTIDINSPLLKSILNDKNLVQGNKNVENNSIGLIISKELIDQLQYDNYPAFLHMSLPIDGGCVLADENFRLNVPIPIVAIVNDLPGDNLYICTEFFFEQRSSIYKPFDICSDEYTKRLIYFVEGNDKKIEVFQTMVTNLINESTCKDYFISAESFPLSDNPTFKKGQKIEFVFNRNDVNFDKNLILSLYNEIKENKNLKNYKFYRIHEFNFFQTQEKAAYHNLSVHFQELNKIRQFEEYLKTNHDLNVDMSQVESKENYNFVSKLTFIISLFLITFSIISIIVFINNILRLHFEKIKPNLGTLKAFGLNNKTIIRIYILIALEFLITASLISFVIALVLGNSGFIRLILRTFSTILEPGQDYFSLLPDWNTYMAFFIILLINSLTISSTINKLLSNSPGNLINDKS